MSPTSIQPPGVRYHKDWYVARPCEENRMRRNLEYSEPILLWGPRQQGRTWLSNHIGLERKAKSPERRVVSIDFRSFASRFLESLE